MGCVSSQDTYKVPNKNEQPIFQVIPQQSSNDKQKEIKKQEPNYFHKEDSKQNDLQHKQGLGQQTIKETQQYRFQCLNQDPDTLTMTALPKSLLSVMYKTPNYYWLPDPQKPNLLQLIEQHMQSSFKQFKDENQLKKTLDQIKISTIIYVPLPIVIEVSQITALNEHIIKIFCYGCQKSEIQQLKKLGVLCDKVNFGGKDDKEILETSKKEKIKALKDKFHPNFISLKDSVFNSNILLHVMSFMLNQKVNRQMLIDELVKLAKPFVQNSEYQLNLLEQLEKGLRNNESLDPKQAIEWYTKQSFLYKLVNVLLRASNRLIQIFILQPFFKDLFNGIKILYKQQQNENKNLECYRGTIISQQQVEYFKKNIDCVVQGLGFFSCSLNKDTALTFCKNAFFIITTNNLKRNSQFDYGFVNVVEVNNSGQQQILFNPLNSYKVNSIKKLKLIDRDYYQIELVYGQIARIHAVNKQLLNAEENYYKDIVNFQSSSNKRNFSGQIFQLEGNQGVRLGKIFYYEYLRLSKNNQHKVWAYLNLGDLFRFEYNVQKQLQYYKKSSQLVQENNDNNALVLSKIGQSYSLLGKYNQALEIFQKARGIMILSKVDIFGGIIQLSMLTKQIGKNYMKLGKYEKAMEQLYYCSQMEMENLGDQHPEYASTLSLIASIFEKQGKYKESRFIYQKCKDIYKKIYGQQHVNYLVNLKNIAIIDVKLQNYESALEKLQQCKIKEQKIFGENHPNYLSTLQNIASIYQKRDHNYKYALELALTQAQKTKQNFGQNHRNYATSLLNIGKLYIILQKYNEAVNYLEKAKLLFKETMGQNSVEYAMNLNSLGRAYLFKERYIDAVKTIQKSESIFREIHQDAHPRLVQILMNKGDAKATMGLYDQAKLCYIQSKQIIQKTIGTNHPNYALCLMKLRGVQKEIQYF